MQSTQQRHVAGGFSWSRKKWARLAGMGLLSVWATSALGQTPLPPAPNPSVGVEAAEEAVAVGEASPEDLAARVQQLEAMMRDMATMRSQREVELEMRVRELESRLTTGQAVGSPAAGETGGYSATGVMERDLTRGGSAGLSPLDTDDVADMPPPPRNVPLKPKFGPGFQLADEEEEFVFQLHNLTQVDGRFDTEGNQDNVRDTFGVPRQWFIFNGRLTKPFEYYVAINEGFDNLNLLDAYLNIHFIDQIQFKVGRYKTPYTYEFYGLPAQGLINPERSQFYNNFALNRDVGLMFWGQLLEKRIDYAAGIFNGNRNGYLDLDNGKDVASFVNFLPFLKSDSDFLKHFNIGGSVYAGSELTPRIPNRLRLNVPTQGNPIIGVPFLEFAPGTLDSGKRAFWSLHTAWYYESLSLIAEWQSGYEFMANRDTPATRTRIPVQSFYVQLGYFLTGEKVEMRNVVKPARPFDLRAGKRGPGAWELALRYNALDVSNRVFSAGFADPALWTNQVETIDVGMNWYWSQYIKTYIGWQHAIFADPVLSSTNPNQFQDSSDLFWFRFQVYF